MLTYRSVGGIGLDCVTIQYQTASNSMTFFVSLLCISLLLCIVLCIYLLLFFAYYCISLLGEVVSFCYQFFRNPRFIPISPKCDVHHPYPSSSITPHDTHPRITPSGSRECDLTPSHPCPATLTYLDPSHRLRTPSTASTNPATTTPPASNASPNHPRTPYCDEHHIPRF